MGLSGCSGCGDDAPATPDAGDAPVLRLSIVGGANRGLAFGESATLEVRYEHESGEAIANAEVDFVIVESPTGDPRGSTLSATSGLTDGGGVATVDVTAGAARANFRVAASADGAGPVYFYIAVSPDGFASLTVRPSHTGPRAAASFASVEVRLYQASEVTCAGFDVDDPPASQSFPPLTTDGFGGGRAVTFDAVGASMDHTLVGWGLVAGSATRVAVGCVDLPGAVITPGARQLQLAITDRQPALPGSVTLSSSILLTPVADVLATLPVMRPWQTLACPAGPGQLLLDCTADALETDGTLDCVAGSTTQRALDIENARGTLDASGCRPLDDGGDTLDKQLLDAVDEGGAFPTGIALVTLLSARTDTLELLELTSVIAFDDGAGTLSHTLDLATIRVSGTDYTVDLAATARPVIAASPVSWWWTAAGGIGIAPHAFTLRLGTLARGGFRDLGLAAAGLDDREDDLGSAMVESASDTGSSTTGCDAVSAVLCTRIGDTADCAVAACAAAAAYLDTALPGWWQTLDGDGLDLRLLGTAPVRDDDDDLVTDSIGVDDQSHDGVWSAAFTSSGGLELDSSGTFGSTALE